MNKEELREQVTSILEEGGDIMQTIAQQLKNEGKKEEKLKTAKRMLLDNIYIEKVVKYTGLPEKEVKALIN